MAEDIQTFIDLANKSITSDEKKNTETQNKLSGLIGVIKERFRTAKDERYATEQRMLVAYQNYRGIYDAATVARIPPNKSQLFVKITKTKVLAAYGQVLEVLFANGKFPIGVEPTSVPEGIAEYAHVDPKSQSQPPEPTSPYGHPGDGSELPPGATAHSLELASLQSKYGSGGFVQGESPDVNTMPQIEPAKEAAMNMEKVIHDQLDESHAETALRYSVFEMCLLGTGVIKGPFTKTKTVNNWVDGGKGMRPIYQPYDKLMPDNKAVSIWNFYLDPRAYTLEDAEWAIQRHPINASQVRDLSKQPDFSEIAIRKTIELGPNYEPQDFEQYLRDNTNMESKYELYEVYEYWGIMDKALAQEAGLDIGEKWSHLTQIPINAWICGDQILRLVVNPFIPARIPYQICPYEIHPYQPYGIGVAENMEDSQVAINGLARMAIDNLNLAGNIYLDVDENALVAGETFELFPGKVFRRQGGQPGQAVFGIQLPNTAPQIMQVFQQFRQFCDEETGIPSYSHGQTGVSGTTRTASGMSMLMGASALNIKTVIKNLDDYMLKPLGEAMFAWNMQFNEEDEIPVRGDLEIRARGTSALMQKEVRSQRLLTFGQVAGGNQATLALTRWSTWLKEVAESLDIEPEKLINDPQTASIYARLIGLQQGPGAGGGTQPGAIGTQSGAMGGPGGMAAGANSQDTSGSGGGNIGTGSAPGPGESGFSAAGS